MFKCHFGEQAARIITIEGRSIYVQDWFNGFLTQCSRRGGTRGRGRKEETGGEADGEETTRQWKKERKRTGWEGGENEGRRRRGKGGQGKRKANRGGGRRKRETVHQVLLPTVEEPSEWRSPPPQRPSTQTQTGPAGETKKGRKREEENVLERRNARRSTSRVD